MAGWSKMVDMAFTDEEKVEKRLDCAMPCDPPDYPYGLRISLDHATLKKLGLNADCDIGDMIDIRCFAEVVGISLNDSRGGPSECVELQITRMQLENEATEVPGDDY